MKLLLCELKEILVTSKRCIQLEYIYLKKKKIHREEKKEDINIIQT